MVPTRTQSPRERAFSVILHFSERAEKCLAHQSMILLAVLDAHLLSKQTQWTLPEKTWGDFPNVVGGSEGDETTRRKILACMRQKPLHRLRHCSDNQTMVPHGECGQSRDGISLGPAVLEAYGGRVQAERFGWESDNANSNHG